MINVRKVRKGNGTYYYLEQTVREGSTIQKKRKYLGKVLPKNVDELKERLIKETYASEWYPEFDRIKAGYSAEFRRMPKVVKEKEMEAFMVAFTYDTQRIEGSKLSFKDTSQVLLEQSTPKGARLRDVKQAEAHRAVFYEMLDYDGDLSLGITLKWHRKLFQETEGSIAGKIRDFNVKISNTKFVPPRYPYVESTLSNFFAWYRGNKDKLHPVELAALAHLKFVTIHPFGDGNGRISRLLMNFALRKHGYPMLNIRYVNRRGYYTALERSQIGNNQHIFLRWLFRKYLKENKEYLNQ